MSIVFRCENCRELSFINDNTPARNSVGGGVFFPINNKVVEVKKIDHEKTSMNY